MPYEQQDSDSRKGSSALVVLSGGQDSTTCLFWALQHYQRVAAVTFVYGQRHIAEIEAARKVAELAGVPHEVVEVGSILAGKSFLTDLSAPVQEFGSALEMDHHNAFKEDKLDSSFVPMRNTLFLTLAANRAAVGEFDVVITGVTAADFAEFGELSWAWLGGFIDAEGCFTRVNGNGYRLSFTQKDPELMNRIKTWLIEQEPAFTCGLSEHTVSEDCIEMTIGSRAYELIAGKLSPHLHNPLRREQGLKHGAPLAFEEEMNDAWLTGFWEGDGGCYSAYQQVGDEKQYTTRMFQFSFYQKGAELLEDIQQYIGKGHLASQKGGTAYELKVTDGLREQPLLTRMKPHLNVLHSFEKINKSMHKVGLDGGCFNPPYPDCTPDYIAKMQGVINESLRSSTFRGMTIVTPVMYLSKARSIKLAQRTPGAFEALAHSHTCYNGEVPPCGHCHACLLRERGFKEAGVPDPLVLRTQGCIDFHA